MTRNTVSRFGAVLFCAAILLSMIVTWRASGHLLDSDASSELVLAKHLAETGRIMSEDWYYSTELRVVNTQLVFTPLFHIFEDWRLIRFIGTMILQGILVASYFLFTRCAKLTKNDFLLGGALLLLPVGVAYGRLVLWHSYYIPHIAFGFTIAGLLLRACREKGWLTGLILVIISFLSGLGGMRQGVITHTPMAALAFLYWILYGKKGVKPFAWAIAAGMGALAGLIVNDAVLSVKYEFVHYGIPAFNLRNLKNWKVVMNGILNYFGYRQGTTGWMTMLSWCGLASGLLVFAAAMAALFRFKRDQSLEMFFTVRFCAAAMSVLACIFLLTNFGQRKGCLRYMVPAVVWAIPMITVQLPRSRKWMARLKIGLIVLLVVSGLVNSGYVFNAELFPQSYDGIDAYPDPDDAEAMSEAARFLLEEGYTVGYSAIRTGNILTELTDGRLRTVSLAYRQEDNKIIIAEWLMEKNIKNEVPEHTFAVVQNENETLFLQCGAENLVEERFRNDFCVVYDVVQPEAFPKMLGNG